MVLPMLVSIGQFWTGMAVHLSHVAVCVPGACGWRCPNIPCSPFFFFFNLFIYYILFLAVLGLHFCVRAFSICGERGPLFIAVRGPLSVAASPVAEHRLQTRRLSSCGSWA